MGRTLAFYVAPSLTHDHYLYRLVNLIPHLPVDCRKTVLTLCQAAYSPEEDAPTTKDVLAAADVIQDCHLLPDRLARMDVFRILYHCTRSHVHRSFVSMMLRNEAFDHLSGASAVIEEGFQKEFWASQNRREEELRISYQCIDTDNDHPSDYSIYYPMTPWFKRQCRHFVHRFMDLVDRMGIIYPAVQRKKNMSVDTCRNLVEAGYQSDRNWRDLRTLDLELFKYQGGNQIGGDCEMRQAWKFNDLKPRSYYCIGGTSYWRSRYVKPIAVAMMESLPPSQLHRRQHPEDAHYSLQEEHWLAIWDMTSFTTTLSELKYFLWYLVKTLEEYPRIRQQPLRCLDYATGIIEIPLTDLLLSYNEGENNLNSFSVWRVCQKLYDSFDETERFQQQNSGMLGVPGNIGFSTAFHAFHLQAGIVPDTGCSAGDDALGGTVDDPVERFIPHMQLIGELNESKVKVFKPVYEGIEPQVAKFLKRRFTRDYNGLDIDYLFDFPALAYVFGVVDEFRTVELGDMDDRVYKFCSQVASLLWALHTRGYRTQEEIVLVQSILARCYGKLGLPFNGSLPGNCRCRVLPGKLEYAVPPIYFDFTSHDWAEWLWDHTSEKFVLLPVQAGEPEIPPYEEDMVFLAGEGGMLNILEDIGVIKKLRTYKELVEVSETNRRAFRKFLVGSRTLWFCQYIAFPPIWFDDVFNPHVYTVRELL